MSVVWSEADQLPTVFEKENTSRNPWTYHRAAGVFKVPRGYLKKWKQNSHRAFRKLCRNVHISESTIKNLDNEKIRQKDMRDGWWARQDIDVGDKRIILPKAILKTYNAKQNNIAEAFIINSYRHKERKMKFCDNWDNDPWVRSPDGEIPSQISKFTSGCSKPLIFPESIVDEIFLDDVEDLSSLFVE